MPYILPPNFRRRGPMLGAHHANHARRFVPRGMRGFGDDTTDLVPIDTSIQTTGTYNYAPLTDSSGNIVPIDSSIQPTYVYASSGPAPDTSLPASLPAPSAAQLTSATAIQAAYTPSNPLYYATPALAIAAGLPAAQVNAAFAANPLASLTSSSSTWLLLGVGAAALLLIGGSGGGKRRR